MSNQTYSFLLFQDLSDFLLFLRQHGFAALLHSERLGHCVLVGQLGLEGDPCVGHWLGSSHAAGVRLGTQQYIPSNQVTDAGESSLRTTHSVQGKFNTTVEGNDKCNIWAWRTQTSHFKQILLSTKMLV